MATTNIDPALVDAEPAQLSTWQRLSNWVREHLLAVYSGLALP